jgi:hypothetical protein
MIDVFPNWTPQPFSTVVHFTESASACGQCPLSFQCVRGTTLFEWKWLARWGDDARLEERQARSFSVCCNCQSLIWFHNDVLYICSLLAAGHWARGDGGGMAGSALRNTRVMTAATNTTIGAFTEDDLCNLSGEHSTCPRLYQAYALQRGLKYYAIRDGQGAVLDLEQFPYGRSFDVYARAGEMGIAVEAQSTYDDIAQLIVLERRLPDAERLYRVYKEKLEDVRKQSARIKQRLHQAFFGDASKPGSESKP